MAKTATKTAAPKAAAPKAPAASTEAKTATIGNADDLEAAQRTAAALVDQVAAAQTEGGLLDADGEAALRKERTSDKAVKAALEAGKKNPLEKFGDPDTKVDPVTRAAGGF